MPDDPSSTENPGSPPQAAEVVAGSETDESETGDLLAARRDLAAEKAGRKAEQTRLASLEDENRRLKDVPKPAARQKRSWLDGATFFHPED